MSIRAVVAAICLAAVLLGPRTRAQVQAPSDQPTFRTATRLATFDAVVTDDKGRHVTDLSPADFEIKERGQSRAVRQVLYVRTAAAAARPTSGAIGTAAGPTRPSTGSGLPQREQTGRVVAIVVDDLNMSFESITRMRGVLTRYIDTLVEPGDLVAILRASGGSGALQQFTTDQRLLAAAIGKIRFVPRVAPVMTGSGERQSPAAGEDGLAEEFSNANAIGTLLYAVRGVETLPGRKTVVLVSEGLGFGPGPDGVRRSLRSVVDRANRAGAVLYAIDPTGLATGQLTAADDPFAASRRTASLAGGPSGQPDPGAAAADVAQALTARRRRLLERTSALDVIAAQTGGFAVIGQNDLDAGLARIIDDSRGYYLIGVETALESSDRAGAVDVQIRLRRPRLRVRARQARFGPSDPDRRPVESLSDPLLAAILSPFASGAIDVGLTALFRHGTAEGAYVRAFVAIDPAGLLLTPSADGRLGGTISLAAVAIDDEGEIAGDARDSVALQLDGDAFERARDGGLRYDLRIPLKRPGGYQVRVAVLDDRSKATGSAAQFVDVPAVGEGRIAISGISLFDASAPAAEMTTAFAAGSTIEYRCTVYDGRRDRTGGLTVRVDVLRDGKPVQAGSQASIEGAAADTVPVGAVDVKATLALGTLPPGAYTLQIGVDAGATSRKPPPAMQWVDFEVR
jgi:VWFA-related protein